MTHKLVPVEPTEAMIEAAAQAILTNLHNRQLNRGAIPVAAPRLADLSDEGRQPLLSDARAALQASLPLPDGTLAVKALEWTHRIGSDDTYEAESPVGRYLTATDDEGRTLWFLLGRTGLAYVAAGQGQAAAQADYTSRIRSALYASPDTLAVEVGRLERNQRELFAAREAMERAMLLNAGWARDAEDRLAASQAREQKLREALSEALDGLRDIEQQSGPHYAADRARPLVRKLTAALTTPQEGN